MKKNTQNHTFICNTSRFCYLQNKFFTYFFKL